ncbi:hypothetical protein ABB37_01063 [Leptomonas pyrrhocoris]|uniref:Leucine-rich repeat protein n=1 Tax=Leptomonas pyrrhocoris TaxID=157538 RepID=A0A0N1J594_LEPPY|nr:hypothetical protein ABB37_01063 [Leptomonas pyrrhocoris]KPA84518.1 hypothetical protein ABB37_01063 [Leptomonas pyrrhocoris]|eukprot:XP_015662957.1 hypothetical protein ABB37_01063 [Leptomonas pyrrhocoris]
MEDPLPAPPAPSADTAEAVAQQKLEEAPACADTGSGTNEEKQAVQKQPLTLPLRSSVPLGETNYAVASGLVPSLAEMNADEIIPPMSGAAPQFPVLHPQGFRILNNNSAMERGMRGYFRLPQPPNLATREEQRRLQRTLRQVQCEEAQRKARITGNQEGVVLDGFLILGACEADDPEEVTAVTLQASLLTSSVQEDLPFFTELKTLDVSDNQLRLGDVLPLPHLETAHLVCNNIVSLADVALSDSSSLSTLMALDLAYNRIPSRDLLYLGAFRALQHLDLSNNGLRSLPADLSALSQLTHLALESNQLASADVFHALGTLPALMGINLANNRLAHVPLLRVTPPLGMRDTNNEGPADVVMSSFPAIQTMTLSGNRFTDLEAFLPLAALHRTLRHIAVGNNPFLLRQPQAAARQLQLALDEAVVDSYFIAKDPLQTSPPLTSTDATATLTDANAGTWHGKAWERYIPPRPEGPQSPDDELARSRASSLETAAPIPSAPAKGETPQHDGATSAQDGESSNEAPRVPQEGDVDIVHLLSVEEYVARFHITVQCGTPPPPPAKQPRRYFYSSAYRASQREGQSESPLVTLPPYEEFMDVYRIAGRQSHASRRKGHAAASRRRGKPSASAPPSSHLTALPVMARDSFTLPPAAFAAPPSALSGKRSSNMDDVDEDDDEEDDDVPRDETQEGDDGFFLTGMNSEGKKEGKGRRKNRSGRKSAEEKATLSAEMPAARKMEGTVADALPTDTQRSTNAFSANQSSVPRLPLPRSVVSPASTNVHTAMSELRAMLRKPLPSLPYDPARSRQAR